MRLPIHSSALALLATALLAAALLAGCGGSDSSVFPPADPIVRAGSDWRELTLVPFQDQWPASAPRWMDIGDVLFSSDFRNGFDSDSSGTITLRYDPTPEVPYLIGEIRGQDLKPNCCYQLKLMGKPGKGSGGLWGSGADMDANRFLLERGRWWNYRTEDPAFTTTNDSAVLRSRDYRDGWVAGYLYVGCFVTNQYGNTDADGDGLADFIPFAANRSYHVTWKTGQTGPMDSEPVPYDIVRTTSYGYDAPGTDRVDLWFEKEPDDPIEVAFPNGTYDVVLMITEESFHASGDGGFWLSVRVSDWPVTASPRTGQPWVSGRGAPITFTIGGSGGPAPGGLLQASVDVRDLTRHGSRWQASAWIQVTDANGQPVEAAVEGVWSGAYDKPASGNAGSDGLVWFKTPFVKPASNCFTFTLTGVAAAGYDGWSGAPGTDTDCIP